MTKIRQDSEFYTGEDKSIVYTITDATGASVNLGGFTVHWLLQDDPSTGSLLLYKTGGSGVTVSGCTATVTIAGSNTAGCNLDGSYYTELSACDSSNNEAVLATGYATIHRRGY